MSTKRTKQPTKKGPTVFVISGILLLAFIVLLISLLSKPSRSVEAFCSTYKKEDARLAESGGDTYSLKPFANRSSDPGDFVTALSKLQKVAPKDIEPDVKTLKQIFEKIDKDPSQALSASLSGLGAESSVSDWTKQNCQ